MLTIVQITHMSYDGAIRATCVGCGESDLIPAGQIPDGEHPLCKHCYMPLVAKEALLEEYEDEE